MKAELRKAYAKAYMEAKELAVEEALKKTTANLIPGVLLDEARKAKKGMWVFDIDHLHPHHDAIVMAVENLVKSACEHYDLDYTLHTVKPLGIGHATAFYVEWEPDYE